MDRRVLPIGFLVLLAASTAVLHVPQSQAAYVNSGGLLIEGFENQTFPAQPASPYYTLTRTGSGTAQLDTAQFESGAQSYKVVGAATMEAAFVIGEDLCQPDPTGPGGRRYVDFSLRIAADVANSPIIVGVKSSDGQSYARFVRQTGGSTINNAEVDGSATSATGAFVLAVGSWGRYGISCDAATATGVFCNYDTASCINLDAPGTFTSMVDRFFVYSSGPVLNVDRVNFGSPPSLTTISASGADYAAASGENILGPAVDISGTNLVYRHTGGASCPTWTCVKTLNAQTMTPVLGTIATGCNRVDGIAAAQENVMFSRCDTTAGDVSSLSVLKPDLSSTYIPPECDDMSAEALADMESWTPDLTGISQLATFEFGSIDYDFIVGGADTGACSIFAFLGFSDSDGKVGIAWFTVTFGGSSVEETVHQRAQYASSSNPADDIAVCAPDDEGANTDEESPIAGMYIIATDPGLTTRVYRMQGDTGDPLTLVSSGSGSLGSAYGISCGGGDAPALLQTATAAYGFNYRTGSTAWALPITGGCARCSAESWDSKWGAVYDDPADSAAVIRILNMTSGEVVGNVSASSLTGTVKWMGFDSSGQNLWVQTDSTVDHIVRFDVHTRTTGLPVVAGDRTPGGNDHSDCDVSIECDSDVTGHGALALPQETCDSFGSCRAAQGFQGLVALSTGAGITGMGTVGAAKRLKLRIDLRVILAAAGVGGFLAVATAFFLDIVADWFFYLMIVLLVGFLVAMGIKAFAGGKDE